MSQTGATPIQLYHSTTPSAVPVAANLLPGELAINIADGTLYYEDNLGVVQAFAAGATISNDTATSSNIYPLLASATSGAATTIYTSNAKLLYKPSTGELKSSVVNAGNGSVINNATVGTSYTIASGENGMSVGPVTLGGGVVVTVSGGSRWAVL